MVGKADSVVSLCYLLHASPRNEQLAIVMIIITEQRYCGIPQTLARLLGVIQWGIPQPDDSLKLLANICRVTKFIK